MPNTLIHIISNIVLLTIIYFFDKEYHKLDKKFLSLTMIVMATILFDIDHLLATPIYDPARCSINFHPLHSWYMMPLYVIGLFFKNKNVRYVCLAILLHLGLDWIDCLI